VLSTSDFFEDHTSQNYITGITTMFGMLFRYSNVTGHTIMNIIVLETPDKSIY